MSVIVLGFSTISVFAQIAALVLLILAIISTPVVTGLKLAEAGTYTYGIFGYCSGTTCSQATFPYSPSTINTSVTNWLMSDSARDSLAKILIFAPIAGGFTLMSIIIGAVAHFRFVANSALVFVVAIVFAVISFLLSTLICIAVILLFHPNIKWTGWVLIGSAAGNLIAVGFYTLAMLFTPKSLKSDEFDDSFEDQTNLMDLKLNDDYKEKNVLNEYGAPQPFTDTASTNKNEVPTYNEYKNEYLSNPGARSISNNTVLSNSNRPEIKDFTVRELNGNGYSDSPNALVDQQNNPNNSNGINIVQGPGSSIQRSIAPSVIARVATHEDITENNQIPGKVLTPYPLDEERSIRSTTHLLGSSSANPEKTELPYPDEEIRSTISGSGRARHPFAATASSFYEPLSSEMKDMQRPEFSDPEILSTDSQSDAGSDFTSVSQRGVNPYHYATNIPAQQSLFPQQAVSNQPVPSNPQINQMPQQYNNYPPPQQQYNNYYPPQQQGPPQNYNNYAPMGYQPNQQGPPPMRSAPRPNPNNVLLANNPDFMVGPRTRRGGPPNTMNRRGRGGARNIPPASLSRDSPYGNLR